jgi:hypothetical protein
MKAQAPEVSDDQVIAQAIKAMCAGPLHSHLVRDRPKTVSEQHEQFTKFSKSEIQHFHKIEQERKIQGQMKPQDLAKMKSSEATLSLYTASTLMLMDHHRIGR